MRFFGRSEKRESSPAPAPEGPWDWESPSGMVVAKGTDFQISAETAAEMKLAIQELKLHKKEVQLEKKQLGAELKGIRTERSQQLAKQGPMLRGGGTFGKMVRTTERYSRQADRSNHANRMAPYQSAIASLDTRIHELDIVILTAEHRLRSIQSDTIRPSVEPNASPTISRVCPSCGAPAGISARYCGSCGNKV